MCLCVCANILSGLRLVTMKKSMANSSKALSFEQSTFAALEIESPPGQNGTMGSQLGCKWRMQIGDRYYGGGSVLCAFNWSGPCGLGLASQSATLNIHPDWQPTYSTRRDSVHLPALNPSPCRPLEIGRDGRGNRLDEKIHTKAKREETSEKRRKGERGKEREMKEGRGFENETEERREERREGRAEEARRAKDDDPFPALFNPFPALFILVLPALLSHLFLRMSLCFYSCISVYHFRSLLSSALWVHRALLSADQLYAPSCLSVDPP